ncbi:MAG TPA: hypothetical protein VGJ53_21380 [Micromonosporaceae bacterium]|jgi:hypothetical protein
MADRDRRRPVWVAAAVAAALAVAYLFAPPMGTDLSAQVARAEFFAAHGTRPIDFSWYAGVNQYGYSLYTAALQAALGVRVVGAVSAVVAAVGFAYLLVRVDARRPVLGAVLGAVVAVGNLVSGRTTFAVGQALGTLALVALAAPRPARPVRLALAAVLAALATWASPVAGLFLGLIGVAVLLALAPLGRLAPAPSWRDALPGLVLCVAAVVAVTPLAVVFGNGGRQPYSAESMRINLALAVVVFVVVPGRYRAVRAGAVLTGLLLIAAYYLPSPIGSNAIRLPLLYALPVTAALAELSGAWLAALLAALLWWQPPVMVGDLTRVGSRETRAAFYRPLIEELARRGPVGRVEVVPLRDHWEARYVAATVPLARGWERQADVDRNALFYSRTLRADAYGRWLRDGAVEYVAYAPDSVPDMYARQEAALVAGGLPYLREVWRDATWRLYAVADPAPLVAAPGRLVRSGAASVTFDVPSPGDVLIRVRYSRWLTLTGGGCPARGPDGWTLVRNAAPGRHELSSSLSPAGCREPT